MQFEDMNLQVNIATNIVKCGDIELEVKEVISMAEKIDLIQFVVNNTIDQLTGTGSPIRTDIWYTIAVCKWYGGIEFSDEDIQNVTETYDALDFSGLAGQIMNAMDQDERVYLEQVVNETIQDISRYNTSAAGIIHSMSGRAFGLDEQITELLEKVKNGEGLEQLAAIKDVVGLD